MTISAPVSVRETPAAQLRLGDVVRVAEGLFAVEFVHRHITRDDLVHVGLRSARGAQLVIERDPRYPMDVVA